MTTEHEDTNGKANETTSDDSAATIERLQQELNETKDKYMRAHAEMENIRRRAERERNDLIKYALENVMKDFLPVLDSLQQAVPDADPEQHFNESGFRDGVVMLKKQVLDTFQKHGLEPVKAAGEPFDPNVHQAIQRIESPDVTVETVGSEFARGYLLHGRLLRPAMVSVLVPA